MFRFGPFFLDSRRHQLLRGDAVVPLTPKAFGLLLLLVTHRDRVVEKSEILRLVWPGVAATDDSLAVCVSALRRALGDDSAHAAYIATVPKRGYRFVAEVAEVADEQVAVAPRTRRPMRVAAAAAVAAAALIVTALVLSGRPSAPVRGRPILLFQDAPAGAELASGGFVSPDGRHLAFVARDLATRQSHIWVRAFDSAEPRMLAGTEGAARPFWAPRGEAIGFFAGGRLRAIPVAGGAVRDISTIRVDPSGASWGAAGTIVFADRVFGLYRVPASGGPPQPLHATGAEQKTLSARWPSFLPDGRRFLYDVSSADPAVAGVYVGDLDSPTRVRLLDATFSSAVFAPPGHLLALRDGALVAQAIALDRLELRGDPVPLVPNVSRPGPLDNAAVSVSDDGLLAVPGAAAPDVLAWFDRSGTRVGTIKAPVPLFNPTLVSSQPLLVATTNIDPQRGGAWIVDLERDVATRIAPDAGGAAVVAPGGDRIAFASTASGFREIYLHGTGDGGNELLLRSDEPNRLDHWSPDARHIAYVRSNADTQQDLWVVPVTGDRTPRPYLVTRANEMHGQFAPDGRWIAYASDESGAWEVYVDSFPVAGHKRTVSVGGGAQPQWRADGRELFYLNPDRAIMAVTVASTAAGIELGRPQLLFRAPISAELIASRNHYAAAADGRRFLVRSASQGGRLQPIRVFVNWPGLVTGPS